MRAQTPTCFGYRIREVEGEWRWTAFDPAGGVRAQGRAPTRAAAAAQVIRALAEAAAPACDRAA
jgi:hypothetical protein